MFSLFTPYKLYAALGLAIILSLIVGVHLYHDRGLRIERDRAISNLESYKLQIEIENSKREAEIISNQREADAKLQQVLLERDTVLKKLNLANVNRTQLSKQIGVINENFNATQTKLADTKLNYDARLQLDSANSTTTMREKSETASGLPTSDSDIASLRDACRLTTIDLKTCYGYLEADTLACGREK